MIHLKASDTNVASISCGGRQYQVDPDGFAAIPEEFIDQALSQGFRHLTDEEIDQVEVELDVQREDAGEPDAAPKFGGMSAVQLQAFSDANGLGVVVTNYAGAPKQRQAVRLAWDALQASKQG